MQRIGAELLMYVPEKFLVASMVVKMAPCQSNKNKINVALANLTNTVLAQ